MTDVPISPRGDPDFEHEADLVIEARSTSLMADLETLRQEIDQNREILRLKMARVEAELIQLTSQQAELQKIQVALDRIRKYLK